MNLNLTFDQGDHASLPAYCLEEVVGARKLTAYIEKGGSAWCIMEENGKEVDKTDNLFAALDWIYRLDGQKP